MAEEWTHVAKGIFKSNKDPNKFRVLLYYGCDEKGRPKKSSKILKGVTLKEAKEYLADFEAKVRSGDTPTPSKKRFADLVSDWNANVGDVRNEQTTQASTKNIQRHLLDFFGNAKVRDIGVSDVEHYMAHALTIKSRGKPLSKRTVNKHRSHLRTLLQYALKHYTEYGVTKNPADLVDAFSTDETSFTILTVEEAKRMLSVLHSLDRPAFETAVNLGLWCGMRREEVCGVRWRSVDLASNRIHVKDIRTTVTGGVVDRSYTKTKKIRDVGIPDYLNRILTAERSRQKALGIQLDYVLCHDDGTAWHPNSLTREYSNFLRRNGLPAVRFHDLRHTASSLLLTELDPVTVAEILGHRQVSTTLNTYAHVIGSAADAGKDAMERILRGNKKDDDSKDQ